jgi:hypothetical protein
VRGINRRIKKKEISELFGKFGQLRDVLMRPPGAATIEYADAAAAD